MKNVPIGTYESANSTGWAAHDKFGRTWAVTAEEAEKIEANKPDPKQKGKVKK